MSFHLVVRPAVEVDIREAEAWYNEQQPGLGSEFVSVIRDELYKLVSDPLLHRVRHRRLAVRWVIPKRFPYRIVYCIKGDTVIVLAVIHAARHDREWKKRS